MKIVNPLLGRPAPAVTPIRMGGATGRIGEFGPTRVNADGSPHMHKGIDLLSVVGWPVFAAHGGTVSRAGWEEPTNPRQGYGQRIWLDGDGVRSVYAHLSKILVNVGDEIEAGEIVGLVGRTGNVGDDEKKVPTHLHFEFHEGCGAVDPAAHLVA